MRAAFSMTRGGAQSSASPMRLARLASMVLPVSIMSIAAAGPTRSGSRNMPPQPGEDAEHHFRQAHFVPGSSTASR